MKSSNQEIYQVKLKDSSSNKFVKINFFLNILEVDGKYVWACNSLGFISQDKDEKAAEQTLKKNIVKLIEQKISTNEIREWINNQLLEFSKYANKSQRELNDFIYGVENSIDNENDKDLIEDKDDLLNPSKNIKLVLEK